MPRVPTVSKGRPKRSPEIYECISNDGISVYFKPSLSELYAELTVGIESFLFFRYLTVQGK